MGKLVDLTGQRFGRLKVIRRAGSTKHNKATWHCICDCGNETIVCGAELRHGDTRSCGCLQREWAAAHSDYARKIRNKDLKPKNQTLYQIWYALIARCENPNNKSYTNYGGRGITVCEAWRLDFYAFQVWAISHGYSKGLTIDRIDNNAGYSPENCRWTTYKVQNNNLRTNVFFEFEGERKTIAQWADITGFSPALIWQRIHRMGWPIERALTEPVHKKKTE